MPLHRRLVRAKTTASDSSSPFLYSTIATPSKLKTTNSLLGFNTKEHASRTLDASPAKRQEAHHILLKPKRAQHQKEQQCAKESVHKEKYELEKVIGRGSFGVVFMARQRNSGATVAIKKVEKLRNVRSRQLEMLREINHPNILKLQDHFTRIENGRQYLFLVTKNYHCDLATLIQGPGIEPVLQRKYIYQMLQAILYLGSKGIAHRDLRPQNIFIDIDSQQAVLGDFGSAKLLRNEEHNVCYIGARAYRAPELIFGSTSYNTQVDMWSLGCVAAQMVNSVPLFRGKTTVEQVISILRVLGTPSSEEISAMNYCFSQKQYGRLPKLKPKAWKYQMKTSNPELIDLISKILVYKPSKRLTPIEALSHKFLSSLHNPEYSSPQLSKGSSTLEDCQETTLTESSCTPLKSVKWVEDSGLKTIWSTKSRPSHNRHNSQMSVVSSNRIFWTRQSKNTPVTSAVRKLFK